VFWHQTRWLEKHLRAETGFVRSQKFSTGEVVPDSGIYRVMHEGHRLPHEVTLLARQIFPRCSKCKDRVQFEVIRHASHIQAQPGFNVVVYELPVFEEEEDDTPEAVAG
jgi:hypothetical protein